MKLTFNLEQIRTTEFGVGRYDAKNRQFFVVPVDADVQTALHEMIRETWSTMQENSKEYAEYDPSEKHASTEYLRIPVADPLCQLFLDLHKANNLPADVFPMNDPTQISCYFVRLTDSGGNRLTALRKATQFKGDLKKKLLCITDDTLKIVGSDVFRLDNDVDLIIDANTVHIWRPNAFESLGDLQEEILKAVPSNVAKINNDLSFVEFDTIQTYAETHPRAARYLTSIRTQSLRRINSLALQTLCSRTGVEISLPNGLIQVDEKNVIGFLEVLDRRRYEIDLGQDQTEVFKATSRRRIET